LLDEARMMFPDDIKISFLKDPEVISKIDFSKLPTPAVRNQTNFQKA